MQLSRVSLIGGIDINTPICVLEEIADTCYIKFKNLNLFNNRNKLINKINKKKSDKIFCREGNKEENSKEYDDSSYRLIAKYVNPHCKDWSKKALLKAFNFLQQFDFESFRITDFKYGWQTNENPESLNACLLYKICKENNIHLNFDTTIDEIATNVRLLLKLKIPSINISVKQTLFNNLRFFCNDSDLINTLYKDMKYILSNIPIIPIDKKDGKDGKDTKDEKREKINTNDLFQKANIFSHEDLSEIEPKNDLEAIVLAALKYKIDIRDCYNPLQEYKFLSNDPYFPQDEYLKERLKNSYNHPYDMSNPYINQIFNPDFPPNLYSVKDLMNLSYQEGLNVIDGDYYSALQVAYLTETFIHGKQNTFLNKQNTFLNKQNTFSKKNSNQQNAIEYLNRENSFLENIEDMDTDEVVSFGIRNSNLSGKNQRKLLMRAFSYGELCETFSNRKNFSIPGSNEIFSDEVIQKLYFLTQKERYPTESQEAYEIRCDLGEEIERIKIFFQTKDEKIKEFLDKYEKCKNKEEIEKILTCLLNCGMYMRNWDGISDYPLKSKDTTFEVVKQIEVDHKVTQSLLNLKEIVQKSLLGKYIMELPLMLYNTSSRLFLPSTDVGEGLTIKERLKIIKKGKGDNSCIRLSSNRIISTAYYYMILLGFRLPFNMDEVSSIA
jgi:hypothetical protein